MDQEIAGHLKALEFAIIAIALDVIRDDTQRKNLASLLSGAARDLSNNFSVDGKPKAGHAAEKCLNIIAGNLRPNKA